MQTMLAAIRRRCSPRPTTLPYYHYHYYNYYFCSHPSGLNIQESPPAAPKPSSSAPAAAAAAELIRNRSYCSCSRSIRFSSIPSIQHPSRHHRRRHCAVHHQHHDVWFSTISSSSSSPALDVKSDPLAIKVTVTGSNHENSNSRAAAASSSTCASTTTTSSTTSSYGSSTNNHSPTTTKSSDQIAEEEILSLQSELRIHFRHASYETALDIAKQLLSRTVLQFGNLHPATASAYNNLGLMNKCLGKYVEAKDAYHEALRIYGEVCGKDHASYAAALSNLGMLERSRVLESEGATDDDVVDEDEGDSIKNEAGVDLAQLRDNNNTHKMAPKLLSALERMQLNETAIEYFDEAYRIRLSELGSSHPHTITSRSQLGSAMAASVIAERRGQVGGLLENELRRLKQSKNVRDAREMEAYVPEALAKAASKTTLSGSKLTRRRWEAAEDHLRGALTTAVENPRGESVHPLMYIPTSNRHEVHVNNTDGRRGLTLPPKEDKSGLSKKQKKELGKDRLREKRRAIANALHGNNEGEVKAVLGDAAMVTTLSAATAAQNLAVFLKHYSDWIRLSLMNENDPRQTKTTILLLMRIINEAHHLYESALHVRSSILPSHHPDVIATKFSLAELLDSPRISSHSSTIAEDEDVTTEVGKQATAIDGDRANQLREDILNAFNVEERDDDGK